MTTQTIRAIETRYANHRFRSRLEARWAVFLTALGVEWRYEAEGFELPSGRRYLPDFWIECDTWIEVKGHDGALNHDLLYEAAAHLPRLGATEEDGPPLLVVGDIPEVAPDGVASWCGIHDDGDVALYTFDEWSKNTRLWWVDYADQLTTKATLERNDLGFREADAAYVTARSARFEHGESG